MQRDFKPYPGAIRHHQPHLPDLQGGVDRQRAKVTIVGGGPVGLTVALALARQGIPCVVLEADDSVCQGSRAICISRRSLEILSRLGAGGRILEKGLPWSGGRSFFRDAEVLRFTMPTDENQWLPPMVNIAQYDVERYLLEAAQEADAGLIDIRWQSEVAGMTRDDDVAVLDVTTPIGAYKIQTDWVVACDGGRSSIREAMDLKLKGANYEGRYVIVDIKLRSDRETERLAFFDPVCNPGSTVLVHKQPDDVWRIDYQLRDDEDADDATSPARVLPRVQQVLDMMGEAGDWNPIWITGYKANALSLERYVHGRVIFAGDAAHLVPIFGVRGLNSGIDDADNLAWKLAAVVRGEANQHLLSSYSAERVFAATENLRAGAKSTEFMAPPSFAYELMREAVLSLAVKHPLVRTLINPRQTSVVAYRESSLNAVDDSACFQAGPRPGEALIECPVTLRDASGSRATHLTRALSADFTLLYFAELDDVPAEVRRMELLTKGRRIRTMRVSRTASHGLGEIFDHTGRMLALYDAAPGTAYLVRPDGHVLGRWRSLSAGQVIRAVDDCLRPSSGGALSKEVVRVAE